MQDISRVSNMSLCQSATILPPVRIVSFLILVIECFKQILHKTPWTLRELDGIDLDFSGISMHDMAFLRGTIWKQQHLAIETAPQWYLESIYGTVVESDL